MCLVLLQGVSAGIHVQRIKGYGYKHYKPKGFFGHDKFKPHKLALFAEKFPFKHGLDDPFGDYGHCHHKLEHDFDGLGGYGKTVVVYKEHGLGGVDFDEL